MVRFQSPALAPAFFTPPGFFIQFLSFKVPRIPRAFQEKASESSLRPLRAGKLSEQEAIGAYPLSEL
ncbi:MAG: hypothetical protein D5S03_07620 [Desulfonatronospira sp. MSAO_Bac3]|nr:MAG: hypothetical protein D5S03_07620 [Desulfonatronospira sp. MSAO_Bac3]